MIGYCRTDGSGFWTRVPVQVGIVRVAIAYIDEDTIINSTHGELRAYFDPTEWNIEMNNLIYTDHQWLTDFRLLLVTKMRLSLTAAADVNYSEAGMQGPDFVSMDIGRNFLREIDPLYRFTKDLPAFKIETEGYLR